jgi:hypothetical protein
MFTLIAGNDATISIIDETYDLAADNIRNGIGGSVLSAVNGDSDTGAIHKSFSNGWVGILPF